jgi:hypothetical protein
MIKQSWFFKYFLLAVIFLIVLLAIGYALFGPEWLPNQPVTDQTKLEPSDPRYVAELLADDELQSIFKSDASEILDILQAYEAYIKKIEAFLNDGAKKFYTHPERQNYIVEIQGERKDKIVALAKKLKPDLTEPEKLYMDFRDFSVAYNSPFRLCFSIVHLRILWTYQPL